MQTYKYSTVRSAACVLLSTLNTDIVEAAGAIWSIDGLKSVWPVERFSCVPEAVEVERFEAQG